MVKNCHGALVGLTVVRVGLDHFFLLKNLETMFLSVRAAGAADARYLACRLPDSPEMRKTKKRKKVDVCGKRSRERIERGGGVPDFREPLLVHIFSALVPFTSVRPMFFYSNKCGGDARSAADPRDSY